MIFVTVGTHEQPFNRLVRYIDEMKQNGLIDDEVIIQTGYSTYEPKYCSWQKVYPYLQMVRFVDMARIVITHGGPSSFIMPLQIGKIPVVVPRQKQFNEHVNDHQLIFTKTIVEQQGNLIVINDIDELKNILTHYDEIVHAMPTGIKSNNIKFNEELSNLVELMMTQKRK